MNQLSVNVQTLEFKEHNKNISVQNIFLEPLYTNTYMYNSVRGASVMLQYNYGTFYLKIYTDP